MYFIFTMEQKIVQYKRLQPKHKTTALKLT